MVKQSRFMLVFFALVLLVGFASAIEFKTVDVFLSIQQGSSSTQTIVIYNENSTANSSAMFEWTGNTSGLSVSVSNVTSILNNTNHTSTITISADESVSAGLRTFSLNVDGDNSTSDSISFNINITQSDKNKIIQYLCGSKYSSSNISIRDSDDGEGWEEKWRIAQAKTITVEDIENNADDDYKFDVRLFFFKNGEDKSSDVADTSDLRIKKLSIDENEEEDAKFMFKVDKDADGSYEVWARVENSDAGCYAEKLSSVSIYKENDDYSIVTDVSGGKNFECAEIVDLEIEITNIGKKDSDRVKIILYNKELGLNMYKEVENLDKGDSNKAVFSFIVPAGASEKTYRLLFSTEFDYDDKNDKYGEESDSDDDYIYSISVLGNCIDAAKPTVTAKLNSTAEVGKDLVVEISLTNNANQTITPTVYAEGYESWAELVSVSPASLSILKQQTGKAYLTITPTKDGQQTFNIKVVYNGKMIEQPVTVTIAKDLSWFSVLAENVGTVAAYLIVAIALLVALILLILLIRALWHSVVGRIVSGIIIVIAIILLVVFFYYLI